MTLNEALEATKKFISVIAENVDNLSLDRSDKNIAAGGVLHLSIEHHASIHLLLEHQHHKGSANALVRPQLEAFVRGAWLHRCATEQRAVAFLDNKDPPQIGQMIEVLEQTDFFKNGALKALKEKLWAGLCSYTHGGGLHVTRRITATEIVSNYSDEEILEMLEVSNLVALMTAHEICEMTTIEDKSKSVTTANNIYLAYKAIPKKTR